MSRDVAISPDKQERPTAERILDIAERLLQTRGFSNFSYADIASELGQALITRYAQRFSEALSQIDHDVPDAYAKLEAYAGLYAAVLRGKRMCMCGILAAEYQTLPKPMRTAVIRFFDDNQQWLAHVLTEGREDHTLAYTGSKDEIAQSILSTLEGAMLLARPYGDLARFNATARQLLAGLAT
jgi:TetR/AcrR family transcriptional repressor of nem operon